MNRKAHSVSWNMIFQDKKNGGLGIKKLSEMNHAFLMKVGWKLKSNPDNIYNQVLIGKYG